MPIPSTMQFVLHDSVWHCSQRGMPKPTGYGDTPEAAFQDYVDSTGRDEESDKLYYHNDDDFWYCDGPAFDDPLTMVRGRGFTEHDAWDAYMHACTDKRRERMVDLEKRAVLARAELNVLQKRLGIPGPNDPDDLAG